MQGTGGGGNNPPLRFLFPLGQTLSGPELCGPGQRDLAQTEVNYFWAEVGPVPFGPRSAQYMLAEFGPVPVGPRSAQRLLGWVRPSLVWAGPALLIYKYIIIKLYYYYICVYMLYI